VFINDATIFARSGRRFHGGPGRSSAEAHGRDHRSGRGRRGRTRPRFPVDRARPVGPPGRSTARPPDPDGPAGAPTGGRGAAIGAPGCQGCPPRL